MKTLQIERKYVAIGITCLLGWSFTFLAIYFFQDYAMSLFIWLPFVMGIVSTVVLGYNNSTTTQSLRDVSFSTLGIFCLGLFFFAMEGIICLFMAAPLGFLFNWLGYRFGRYILNDNRLGNPPTTTLILILSVPTFMAFENKVKPEDNVRSVFTSVEISATPEEIWQNVVQFPQLAEPSEWIFKTGIAYPINAKTVGEGVGAIRHCNFSTGSFVEPITTWDKPNLLQFNVDEQPEPMKELSLYDIHPNHLHGYWVSKKGQFKLIQLDNGKTRLEGTTWYINKIKPDMYWTLWSDFIVHKIHQRVLNHIKLQTESNISK
jgi:hypothetical protein